MHEVVNQKGADDYKEIGPECAALFFYFLGDLGFSHVGHGGVAERVLPEEENRPWSFSLLLHFLY